MMELFIGRKYELNRVYIRKTKFNLVKNIEILLKK